MVPMFELQIIQDSPVNKIKYVNNGTVLGHCRRRWIKKEVYRTIPANTRCSPNAGLMLGHRLRRWLTIKPALGQRLVSAGIVLYCGRG